MRKLLAVLAMALSGACFGAVYLVDGQRIEGELHEEGGMRTLCTDELCIMLPDDAICLEGGPAEVKTEVEAEVETEVKSPAWLVNRNLVHGNMEPGPFIAKLKEALEDDGAWRPAFGKSSPTSEKSSLAGKAWWLVLIIVLMWGLAMNLTPCVLPMMPINLMIIGKSAKRGLLYGLGIALAYGTLGLLAAVAGMAFGEIQGNPWFNLAIGLLFVGLGLSMMGVFFIDLSKGRGSFVTHKQAMGQNLFAFLMGLVSAVLAGACIAPVLISVLLLTSDLCGQGHWIAAGLPFVMGVGMALPWPLAGAGFQMLPKPGAWMKWVNKAFGLVVFGFAVWYLRLAVLGFLPAETEGSMTPETFTLDNRHGLVLVDCWASWCKNCKAMERGTLASDEVKAFLAHRGITVVRLQAEKIAELRKLSGFGAVRGLPAFVLFKEAEPESSPKTTAAE